VKRADDWLTETRPISSIFKNVVVREPKVLDKPVNETIQETGTRFDGKPGGYTVVDEDERSWYKRHKGYSKGNDGPTP